MNSLIKIAVVLAFTAFASGNIPAAINQVRKAQFQLVQESKASKLPKAMRIPCVYGNARRLIGSLIILTRTYC